jgi:hypothetical protein
VVVRGLEDAGRGGWKTNGSKSHCTIDEFRGSNTRAKSQRRVFSDIQCRRRRRSSRSTTTAARLALLPAGQPGSRTRARTNAIFSWTFFLFFLAGSQITISLAPVDFSEGVVKLDDEEED